METPSNLRYGKTHEWVEDLGDGTFRLGITDFAQSEMGDIVYMGLPEVGDTVDAGTSFAEAESVKAVEEVISPVNGTVSAINEDVEDDPGVINTDPYGTWLIEVSEGELVEETMSAEEYDAFIQQ